MATCPPHHPFRWSSFPSFKSCDSYPRWVKSAFPMGVGDPPGKYTVTYRVFPKIGGKTPKMDGFWMENPIKMDDLGGNTPYFWKHPYPTLEVRKIINSKRAGMGMGYGTAPRYPDIFEVAPWKSWMASEPGGWSNGWRESEAKAHIPDFMVMKPIQIQESKRNITLKWINLSNVIGHTQFPKSHQKVTIWHDEPFYQQVKWITLHRPNEIYLHTFWKAGNHAELSYISDFSWTISWRKHPKEANQEFLFAKVVRKCWTNELSSTMYNDYINMTKCEKVYTNTLCAHFVSSIEYNTPS